MRLAWLFLLILTAGCAFHTEEGLEPISEPVRYVRAPEIIYPILSRRMGEEGTDILRVNVLADGSTGTVQIHKSSGHKMLDTAAIESMKEMKFIPAKTKSGKFVATSVLMPIAFKLLPEDSPDPLNVPDANVGPAHRQ